MVVLFSSSRGIIFLSFILYLRFFFFCRVVMVSSGMVMARVCNVARREVCLWGGGRCDAPPRCEDGIRFLLR